MSVMIANFSAGAAMIRVCIVKPFDFPILPGGEWELGNVGPKYMVFVPIPHYLLAIRQRSRWQRASILTRRACYNKITPSKRADLPDDSFCASVHSRGTVVNHIFVLQI